MDTALFFIAMAFLENPLWFTIGLCLVIITGCVVVNTIRR
jgi:hypothetical protein